MAAPADSAARGWTRAAALAGVVGEATTARQTKGRGGAA